MCFGCSKELSHQDGSFEYPQHMFWFRNKQNNFQLHTFIWRPEQIVVVFFCKCTNKTFMKTYMDYEDPDQSAHLCKLILVFAVQHHKIFVNMHAQNKPIS